LSGWAALALCINKRFLAIAQIMNVVVLVELLPVALTPFTYRVHPRLTTWRNELQVKGFPTLKFVTADGEVLDYSGDRSEEDLVKFIKGHADSKADDPTVRKVEL